MDFFNAPVSIIIFINTIEVYYDLVLVLKVVVAIFIISTTISKWLKTLLASSMLIKVTLLSIRSLKDIK